MRRNRVVVVESGPCGIYGPVVSKLVVRVVVSAGVVGD